MATEKPQKNPKSTPHIIVTPSVALSFHSYLFSSTKITLKQDIIIPPVCTALSTGLINEHGF